MTPERFRQVDELVNRVLEQEPRDRGAFLDKACSGDDELRREVESLLASDERAADFLSQPAAQLVADLGKDDFRQAGPKEVSAAAALPTNVIGRYVLEHELGSGGMGFVYAARDPELNRRVAIKLVRLAAEGIDSQRGRARLLREAQVMAQLSHPNVLTVHDVGTVGDQVFIAMEFVEGYTLADWVAREQPGWRDIVRVFVEAGRGLAAAHTAGILHRDFKSQNVLLSTDGRVRVADFGLAKAASERQRDEPTAPATGAKDLVDARSSPLPITDAGQLLGTPPYMAPEQLQGKPLDARSDQFSYCVALHEALYGELPFSVEATAAISSTRGEGSEFRPASLAQLALTLTRPGKRVPSALCKILARGLQLDPQARFASMPAVLRELEGVLARRSRRVVIAAFATALALFTAIAWMAWLRQPPYRQGIQSIAVLPIESASGDPSEDFLVDGITEGVMNNLAQVGSLRVISRVSAMKYKHETKPIAAIGRELGVDAVVRGTLTRVGDRLELSAELVQVASDRHLWARRYSRDRRDLAALQADLARDVVAQLKARITPEEQQRLAKSQAVEADVYEAYLAGNYFLAKSTQASVRKAMKYFEEALQKSSNYAPAYVGLANAYRVLGSPLSVMPLPESTQKAKEAVTKALALDDSLADAHAQLGAIKHRNDWDWSGAEKEFRRAIQLSPGKAYPGYGLFLLMAGRLDEGCAEFERVRQLDPVSPGSHFNLASCFERRKQYDAAFDAYRKAIEIDPNYPRAHAHFAGLYMRLGRHDEALTELEKARELFGPNAWIDGAFANVYALQGRREEAAQILKQLETNPTARASDAATTIAKAYGILGRHDEAFQWLNAAYESRSYMLLDIKVAEGYEPLRSDPRFDELVRRVGSPP
jgi:serine/threonine-protein kinase